MPLNHMGYIVDYADALDPLPDGVLRDRYAGIATWFAGFLPENRRKPVGQWLQARMDEGMPLAIVGDIGQSPDRQWARKLGLQTGPLEPHGALRRVAQHPMLGFETAIPGYAQLRAHAVDGGHEAPGAGPGWNFGMSASRNSWRRAHALGASFSTPMPLAEVPGTDYARWVMILCLPDPGPAPASHAGARHHHGKRPPPAAGPCGW